MLKTDIKSKLQDVDHVGYPINNELQLCLSLARTLETSMGGSSGAVSLIRAVKQAPLDTVHT